jgi:hypothetical protein
VQKESKKRPLADITKGLACQWPNKHVQQNLSEFLEFRRQSSAASDDTSLKLGMIVSLQFACGTRGWKLLAMEKVCYLLYNKGGISSAYHNVNKRQQAFKGSRTGRSIRQS